MTGVQASRWDHPPERPFWACLSKDQHAAFVRAGERRAFRSGAVLCEEGSGSAHVIVIKSGWAKVTARIGGRNRTVAVRGEGDLVGERAALTQRSRSATVTALGEVTGLALPARAFQELVVRYPAVGAALDRQERERTAEDGHLHRAGQAGIEYRMAYLLRELALRRGERTPAGTSLALPMSPREVARWVDAETEAVRRVLAAWRHRGVVVTDRGHLVVPDARLLDDPVRTPSQGCAWSGHTCTILYTDVAGFSAAERNGADRSEVRKRMYEILRRAFEGSGVPWRACYHEDRGDGVLMVVPPEVPPSALADQTLARLAAELRKHNRWSSDVLRIRLRVALHTGSVSHDGEGLCGDAVIHAARLLDAPPLREAVRGPAVDLALMASDHVYGTVLQDSCQLIDPESFCEVGFRVKGAHFTGRLKVFGPDTGITVAAARSEPVSHPSTGTHFHGDVQISGDLVVGNQINSRQ